MPTASPRLRLVWSILLPSRVFRWVVGLIVVSVFGSRVDKMA